VTDSKALTDNHKNVFAIVGELVMSSCGIDWQLNRVLIEVLDIGGPLLVEPVVATLDTRLKIEMLKERAKHISQDDWRKGVNKYCDKVEKVFKIRNIVCHTPAVLKENVWTFKPVAAAKMFKNIDLANVGVKQLSMQEVSSAVITAREALGAGENLIENFQRFNTEKRRRGLRR